MQHKSLKRVLKLITNHKETSQISRGPAPYPDWVVLESQFCFFCLEPMQEKWLSASGCALYKSSDAYYEAPHQLRMSEQSICYILKKHHHYREAITSSDHFLGYLDNYQFISLNKKEKIINTSATHSYSPTQLPKMYPPIPVGVVYAMFTI